MMKLPLLLIAAVSVCEVAGWSQQDGRIQPSKTMCHTMRFYMSSSSTLPLVDVNLADESDLVTLWAGLGYRLIHSCAAAQVQIEYRIRAVGPPDDPNSKAQLTLILKTGTRTEKLDVPYTTRLQLRSADDYSAIGRRFGIALPNLMVKTDPTFKKRFEQYARQHPLANP